MVSLMSNHPIGLRSLADNPPTFVASALNALTCSGLGFANRFRRVGDLFAVQSEPLL